MNNVNEENEDAINGAEGDVYAMDGMEGVMAMTT